MPDLSHVERIVVIEKDIERAQQDLNAIGTQHRDAVLSLTQAMNDISQKLDAIDKKVSRFEWLMSGITMTIAAIAWLAGVFNISLGDLKK